MGADALKDGVKLSINGLRPDTLKEAIEVIEVIFDTNPTGIFIHSQDGRLVACNRAACAMHGFSQEEMLGMAPRDFIHPEGYQTFINFQKALAETGSFQGEICGITASGERFDVEVVGRSVIINNNPYFYSAVRDTTDSRRQVRQLLDHEKSLEQLVEQRTDALAKSNRDLEQFAYLTSHDLQEPLRTISSCARLLNAEHLDPLNDDARRALDFIVEGAERMTRMIKDLLEHSRLDADAALELVDCQALVGHVVQDLATTIEETRADITSEGLPTLLGQRTKLELLFQNLIGNAVKFRRPDTSPRVTIRATSSGDTWTFSVADNGIGLAKQHHERVFRVFQRVYGRDKFEGSGIGLAHCRKIVEQNGGNIWIESELGQGTTVHFTWLERQP